MVRCSDSMRMFGLLESYESAQQAAGASVLSKHLPQQWRTPQHLGLAQIWETMQDA